MRCLRRCRLKKAQLTYNFSTNKKWLLQCHIWVLDSLIDWVKRREMKRRWIYEALSQTYFDDDNVLWDMRMLGWVIQSITLWRKSGWVDKETLLLLIASDFFYIWRLIQKHPFVTDVYIELRSIWSSTSLASFLDEHVVYKWFPIAESPRIM